MIRRSLGHKKEVIHTRNRIDSHLEFFFFFCGGKILERQRTKSISQNVVVLLNRRWQQELYGPRAHS